MYRNYFGGGAASQVESDFAAMTGGLERPTASFTGPNLTIDPLPFVSLGNEAALLTKKTGTFPGGNYTPVWPGGATQEITYLAIIVDHATGIASIKEGQFYRSFTAQDVLQMVALISVARDVSNGNILQTFRYALGPFFNSLTEKIDYFLTGSQKIEPLSYQFKIETAPFGGATGCYFSIQSGTALTAGRNSVTDDKQTYVVFDDVVQGASSRNNMNISGRSNVGNEGHLVYRVSGTNARVLSGQVPMYEPTPVQLAANLVTLPANQYVAYRLVIFPGSLTTVMQPDSVTSNSLANAIATNHVYDTEPFKSYDRFLPAIHVGYFACKGDFNPLGTWASNAGKYAFYDTNKLVYTA